MQPRTIKEAAAILADTYAAARVKRASGLLDSVRSGLSSVGDWAQQHAGPAMDWARQNKGLLGMTGAGAALGGLYGGGMNMLADKDERNVPRGVLGGALSGAALGGGLGLLGPHWLNHDFGPSANEQAANKVLTDREPTFTQSMGARYAETLGNLPETLGNFAKRHPLMAGVAAGDAASSAVRHGADAALADVGMGGSSGTTLGQLRAGLAAKLKAMAAKDNKSQFGMLSGAGGAGGKQSLNWLEWLQRAPQDEQFRAIASANRNVPFGISEPSSIAGVGPTHWQVDPSHIRETLHAGGPRLDFLGSLRTLLGKDPLQGQGYNVLESAGAPLQVSRATGWIDPVRRAWNARQGSLTSRMASRAGLYGMAIPAVEALVRRAIARNDDKDLQQLLQQLQAQQ